MSKKTASTLCLALAMLLVLTWAWFKAQSIKRDGRYTVAYKIGTTNMGKNAGTSDYAYHYNGQQYEVSISDYGAGPQYIFIQFIPNSPSSHIKVDAPVPECFQNNDIIPDTGWTAPPISR